MHAGRTAPTSREPSGYLMLSESGAGRRRVRRCESFSSHQFDSRGQGRWSPFWRASPKPFRSPCSISSVRRVCHARRRSNSERTSSSLDTLDGRQGGRPSLTVAGQRIGYRGSGLARVVEQARSRRRGGANHRTAGNGERSCKQVLRRAPSADLHLGRAMELQHFEARLPWSGRRMLRPTGHTSRQSSLFQGEGP